MTGNLSKENLLALIESLPVYTTFVDKDDVIRHYNKSGIFKHEPSQIGTKVQDCHSKKTHKKLNQILGDFRNNRSDLVEYWLD